MKGFKKISSTNTHSVYSHPDGHFIKIAHKNLPAGVSKDLGKVMNHYADGGEIVDKDEADKFGRALGTHDDPPMPSPSPARGGNVAVGGKKQLNPDSTYEERGMREFSQGGKVPRYADGTEEPVQNEDDVYGKNLIQNPPQPEDQPTPTTAPPQQDASQTDLSQASLTPSAIANAQEAPQTDTTQATPAPSPYGFESEKASLRQEPALERSIGESKATLEDIEGTGAGLQAKQDQNFIKAKIGDIARFRQERDKLVQELNDGRVDPDRYIKNMSTAGKIATGIGLVMGGIGSGLTGQPNLAFNHFENQIKNDVSSQEQNLGIKRTLLSDHLSTFKNIEDAKDAVQVASRSVLAHKLLAAGTQARSDIARNSLNLTAAQLQAKNEEDIRNKEYQLNWLNPQFASQYSPTVQIAHNPMIPEKERSKLFDEYKNMQDYQATSSNVMNLYDKVAQENTIARGIGRMGRQPPSLKAFKVEMDKLAKQREGRVQGQTIQDMHNLASSPGQWTSTDAEQRDNLMRMLGEGGRSPLLEGYRIQYPQFQLPKTKPMKKK